MPAEVTYPGINSLIAAEFTASKGAYPSIATVRMLPQEILDLEPGPLTFTGENGGEVTFECYPDMAFLRRYHTNDRWRWSLQLFDKRKNWEGKSITGRYNVRLSDGKIADNTKKTARELFTILFTELGEPAFDVAEAPATVYPRANWEVADIQDELTKLCAMCAVNICPQSDGTFKICKDGTGQTPPVEQFSIHPEFKFKPRRVPKIIEVVCGPDVFEAKWKLQAIGRNTDGDHKLLANLEYAVDWNIQHPYSFIDVAGDAFRASAFESVWRYFRAYELAEGGMTPFGCEINITKMHQVLPFFDWLISSFTDLEDIPRVGFWLVDGDWWPYSDWPENVEMDSLLAPIRLFNEWGVIKTDKPVWKHDANFRIAEPALYLLVAFNAKTLDGVFVRLKRTRTAGGFGTLTLNHPEIFRAFRSIYDGVNRIATFDNANEAAAEADAYLDLFTDKFADPWSWEGEYADIREISTNGKVAQVRWQCGMNLQPLTHFGVNEEFDVYNLSARQREVAYASG